MKIKRSVLLDWQNKFPGYDAPWTHWRVEGDGAFLETVSLDELSTALSVIKANWKRFDSIKVSPAKFEEDGTLTFDNKRNVEIYSVTGHREVEEA